MKCLSLSRMLGLLLCISLAAPAGAQYEFKWKTKKGKAALTYKEKGEKVRVLTDYVYDVGVPQAKCIPISTPIRRRTW